MQTRRDESGRQPNFCEDPGAVTHNVGLSNGGPYHGVSRADTHGPLNRTVREETLVKTLVQKAAAVARL
jgi:hypothetical protein